jgi:hypothetical protein
VLFLCVPSAAALTPASSLPTRAVLILSLPASFAASVAACLPRDALGLLDARCLWSLCSFCSFHAASFRARSSAASSAAAPPSDADTCSDEINEVSAASALSAKSTLRATECARSSVPDRVLTSRESPARPAGSAGGKAGVRTEGRGKTVKDTRDVEEDGTSLH